MSGGWIDTADGARRCAGKVWGGILARTAMGVGASGEGARERAIAALERRVLVHLAEELPVERALDDLARGLEEIAPEGMLASVLVVERGRTVRHGGAPSLPESYLRAIDGEPIGPAAGSCGTAASRRERVIVTDIARDPLWDRYRELALAHGLRACWSQPIVAEEGEVLGTVALYYREPRAPSDEDLATIEGAAYVARVILARERRDRQRAREARCRAALHAAASELARADTARDPEVLGDVVIAVARELGWDAGAVWITTADHARLECAACWGRDDPALAPFLEVTRARTFAPGEGLPGRVLAGREPVWHAIVPDDPDFPRWPHALAAGVRTGFALPIAVGDECSGALELFTTRAEPADTELMDTLRTVGLQVGQFRARARAHRERERLLAELASQLAYAERFSAILGHDLRSPLSAMLMGAQLLRRRASEPETIAAIERIEASGQRMSRMIQQLLDVARARGGGGIPVARGEIDLEAVARHVAAEVQLAFPSRALSIAARGALRGAWDEDRLAQVLSNLLGNAMEHGDREVPVSLTLDGEDPERARIDVHNAGVIDPAILPELFDPFRSGRPLRRSSQGLGLGLFVAREIVLAHGGELDVATSSARGTTFRVLLPRAERARSREA